MLTNADVSNISTYAGSFGAGGTVSDTDSGVDAQIAYDLASGLSETLIVNLDSTTDALSFTTLSLQTASFGEVGHYAIYNGGVLVHEADFTDTTGTGNDTILVSGFGDFDQIVFTALIQTDLTDGSDYGVSNISFVPSDPATIPGNDSIDGGAGDDTILGEEGDDTLTGGTGNDSLTGGTGSDQFSFDDGSGTDTITDFDLTDSGDGTTIDQLDLSGLTDAGGDPVNIWDVTVTDTNGDGTGDAILTFPNGESITLQGVLPTEVDSGAELHSMGIPCFTSGTQIATPNGAVAVENLNSGDLVSTIEHGPMPVRWIGSTILGDGAAPLTEKAMPVRIKPGAIGNRRPLIVSPQHCILMMDGRTGNEVYARAKFLAEETQLASYARGQKVVTYVHVLLDKHATLISNDIPSESFYPGPMALEMLSIHNRIKMYTLIPELNHDPVELAYSERAAPVLTRKELRVMAVEGVLAGFEAKVLVA